MVTEGEKKKRGWLLAGFLIGGACLLLLVYIANESSSRPRETNSASTTYTYIPIEGAPSKGPEDALVTIVEFSDFQCPHCREAAQRVGAIVDSASDLRLVFRHSPLSQAHPHAVAAAAASLAAQDQGRFWDFHDALFARQGELQQRGTAFLLDLARELELDVARFESTLHSSPIRRRVRTDRRFLLSLGQGVVPTFFINGRVVRGALPREGFERIIDEERQRARRLLEAGTPRDQLYERLSRGSAEPVSNESGDASPEETNTDAACGIEGQGSDGGQPSCGPGADGSVFDLN